MLGSAHPVAKCFASYCLNVSHVPLFCSTMKRRAPVANSRIKSTHSLKFMYVCVCVCWNVHSFVYSFMISNILTFLHMHAPLLVLCVCVRSERVNQLNYLWWWINRFVFRWRAQLAALSTTNCRRIEWWNLERERVLGQSQCYSWFRGFFLTQQSWTLWETR